MRTQVFILILESARIRDDKKRNDWIIFEKNNVAVALKKKIVKRGTRALSCEPSFLESLSVSRDLRVANATSLRRAFLCLAIREQEVIHFLGAQWQD